MSRRNAISMFSQLPRANIGRSTFDRSASVKTTFNAGDLIPFWVDEVLPGDTFSITTSKVVRLQTPITPFMDNLFLDTFYFFVPARLCWKHWINFQGENTESAWVPDVQYTIPQLTAPSGGWKVGTIADYMGIPTGVSGLSVNALPFRAYALICNDWFRDENLQDPLNISLEDATQAGTNGDNYIIDVPLGGKPFVASKFHDYFTAALPAPQKGPDVEIPLLQEVAQLPVRTGPTIPNAGTDKDYSRAALRFASTTVSSSGAWSYPGWANLTSHPLHANTDATGSGVPALVGKTASSGDTAGYGSLQPINLWADTSPLTTGVAATINSLRLAFQVQKYFEKLARGGSRYIESIAVMFGVTNPDYRLQRPEYLGGCQIPIVVNQVIQTSETTATSPQGATAAQSLTSDTHKDFTKSFTEHGYLLGLMCVRYHHVYQQGLAKMWSRRDLLDFYFPVFANLGEMPILNKEIYAQGTAVDDEVFGYQEAWAEYRYKPSIVTGEMRSSYAQSLDIWHLADDYTALPKLSAGWIKEDKSNVDRVLSVTSTLANQFFADIYVKCKATRPMPVYSIPGLIDHH